MLNLRPELTAKIKNLLESNPLQWYESRDIAYLLGEKYGDVFDVIETFICEEFVWVGYNTDGIRIIRLRPESTVKRCYIDFFPSEFNLV